MAPIKPEHRDAIITADNIVAVFSKLMKIKRMVSLTSNKKTATLVTSASSASRRKSERNTCKLRSSGLLASQPVFLAGQFFVSLRHYAVETVSQSSSFKFLIFELSYFFRQPFVF